MKEELLILLLIILLPSKYESISSTKPTADNLHLVSSTQLDGKLSYPYHLKIAPVLDRVSTHLLFVFSFTSTDHCLCSLSDVR